MLGAVVKTKINRCLFWKTTPALEVRSGRIALREGPQNGRYQTPKRRSRIGIHVHMTLTSFTSHHVLSCLRTVFTFRDSQDDSPFIDATRSITRCSVRRTLSSSLISIRSSLMAARSAHAAARSTKYLIGMFITASTCRRNSPDKADGYRPSCSMSSRAIAIASWSER